MDVRVLVNGRDTVFALINGISYPVEVHGINKERWLAKVKCLNAEPFHKPTHGGWAYYADGFVTISNLRDADGNVVPLERQRIESKNN